MLRHYDSSALGLDDVNAYPFLLVTPLPINDSSSRWGLDRPLRLGFSAIIRVAILTSSRFCTIRSHSYNTPRATIVKNETTKTAFEVTCQPGKTIHVSMICVFLENDQSRINRWLNAHQSIFYHEVSSQHSNALLTHHRALMTHIHASTSVIHAPAVVHASAVVHCRGRDGCCWS